MPCATVHLLVADLVWEHWSNGATPPFPLTEAHRNAFLHGSLAPDLGFIPGVDRIVSELAHYHRPADLTRALMSAATDERERAFAWGWVAHVVGDVEIHPLVGRAVGERIHGTRDRRMNAAEDVETHVSVEVGLDIVVRSRHPATSPPPARPFFDERSIGWVGDALASTYGVRWSEGVLAAWHRTAVVRTRRWPLALALLARGGGEWRARRRPFSGSVLRGLAALPSRGTPVRGFLRPRRPPEWVVAEFDQAVERVLAQVQELTTAGLTDLPNRNLESGARQDGGDPHPESVAVRGRLDGLRTKS